MSTRNYVSYHWLKDQYNLIGQPGIM